MPSNRNGNNKNKSEYGDNYKYSGQVPQNIYSNSRKSKKYSRSKTFNIAVVVLSFVFALAGVGLLYGYNIISSFNYESNSDVSDPSSNSEEELTGELTKEGNLLRDPQVLNVMLFGLDDQSAGDNGRTDTMLMVSIDNRHKKLKLTTFMRDIWVQIPGHGEEKLNAAFAFGGPKLSVETIERTFGVNIDRYAMVHFDGFAEIVDALDGIDMELSADEAATINELCDREGMKVDKKLAEVDGVHHLSGFQALNHARNRDSIRSDFDRTDRQRAVLSTIVSKTKSANLKQIMSIISSVAPKVTMSFKPEEVVKLASNTLTYVNYEIQEFRLPEDDNFSDVIESNGAAALEINSLRQARQSLAKFLYEESIKTIS